MVQRSVAAALIGAPLISVAPMLPTQVLAAWSCADKDKHTLEQTIPLNIGQLKFQLRDYRYCGGYDADFASKITEAKMYVRQRALQVDKPALVLDIDGSFAEKTFRVSNPFYFIP